MQREERESRKRPEIDLNCSLQEKDEYFADHVEADDTNDCKRLKSCFGGMDVDRNRIKDIINDRCSLPVNGRGPSIFGNDMYDMSIVPLESDSVGNKYSWKHLLQQQQHVLSNDSGKQVNSSVPNLELALGVERSPSAHRNMTPSFMLMSNGDPGDEIFDTNPSLALSLALPCPKAGGSGSGTTLKHASEMKLPKCQEVNTTLSLFGGSSES